MDHNRNQGQPPYKPRHAITTQLDETLFTTGPLSPTSPVRGMPSPMSPGLASPPGRSGKLSGQSPSMARGAVLPSPALTTSTIGQNDSRYAQQFIQSRGRRYHRDTSLAYPLPCDITELHRQTMRQLMLTSAFGAPFCSPIIAQKPPKRVLDVGCGTGIWASQCHEYFSRMGYRNVEFIGLDIAPLAANLKEQGVNWIFVQHDLRNFPLPFADDSFDFVFAKDLSLVVQTTGHTDRMMDEYMRILKSGGVLEMWESDHTVRSLEAPTRPPSASPKAEVYQAAQTATYILHPGVSFTTPHNEYLKEYNSWITTLLNDRKLTPVPCTLLGSMMMQEAESLIEHGSRRVAIPMSEINWERKGIGGKRKGKQRDRDRESSKRSTIASSGSGSSTESGLLSEEQTMIRRLALLTTVQMIESLEPLLREASKKNMDDWDRWFSSMMTDLLDHDGTRHGECVEVGAWWGKKV